MSREEAYRLGSEAFFANKEEGKDYKNPFFPDSIEWIFYDSWIEGYNDAACGY